jgi:hypothetical protein
MRKQNFIAKILCSLGKDKFTKTKTEKALQAAYEKAQKNIRDFDIHNDKWILVSDLHRGAKNKADDFRLCEAAYCAALAYYHELDYCLCIMGDAEELWEENTGLVLKRNDASFSSEKLFHDKGHYLRLWGNHDGIWSDPENVQKDLQPLYGNSPLEVPEAILLRVKNGTDILGDILLVHGHQGTQNEGKNTKLSKWILHNFWRPIQQLTKISCNSPARDWKLRNERDKIIYNWVSTKSNLVLIAGHTHAPVFASRSHRLRLIENLSIAREKFSQVPIDQKEKRAEGLNEIARLSAELEWREHKISDEEKNISPSLENPLPCYFNTGCCSFSDGDITGIEIADGAIRLVRWPDDNDQPMQKILQSSPLETLFNELQH